MSIENAVALADDTANTNGCMIGLMSMVAAPGSIVLAVA